MHHQQACIYWYRLLFLNILVLLAMLSYIYRLLFLNIYVCTLVYMWITTIEVFVNHGYSFMFWHLIRSFCWEQLNLTEASLPSVHTYGMFNYILDVEDGICLITSSKICCLCLVNYIWDVRPFLLIYTLFVDAQRIGRFCCSIINDEDTTYLI